MKDNHLAQRFSMDVDQILEGNLPCKTGDTPPEYKELLQLASVLKETDFSSQSQAREKLRLNLASLSSCKNTGKYMKGAIMNTFFKIQRPALVLAVAAVITLFSVTLIFPGKLMAMATTAGFNIIETLGLSEHITVMQVENPSSVSSTPSQKSSLEGEESSKEGSFKAIIRKVAEPAGDDVLHYSQLNKAQQATAFKVLCPSYLPSGYTFKEAQGYPGSNEYINLFFSGPGQDIILMQRLMNENTAFELATDTPVESLKINGVNGAWLEPHTLIWEKNGVGYNLYCKGFSKAEAMKVAESIK